jgi:hypothetical protein
MSKTYGDEKGKTKNAESFVQVWLREIEERSSTQRNEVLAGKKSLQAQSRNMSGSVMNMGNAKCPSRDESPQTPPDQPDSTGNSPMEGPGAILNRVSYFATHDQKQKAPKPSFLME